MAGVWIDGVRSDDDGFYAIRGLAVGEVDIVFRCPSRRLPLGGREFDRRRVSVFAATDSLLNFALPADRCVEPPIERVQRTIAGYYRNGFESSFLEACRPLGDLRGTAYEGLRAVAWVDWKALSRLVTPDAFPDVPVSEYQERRWYVEWRGWLEGPGSYGQMGAARYLFTPIAIVTIRAPDSRDCS